MNSFVFDKGETSRDEMAAPARDVPVRGDREGREAEIVAALRTVYDPEIPVNIYDLGLVYKLAIGADGDVAVDMTLTAPGCPVAGEMPGQVAEAVAKVAGVGRVSVTLVWEPGWTPERMSADAKLALGMI